MTELRFERASIHHVEQAADLFLDGKALPPNSAVKLFHDEFSTCEAQPDSRIYLLAFSGDKLVAYAGARFYDQKQDENMYQTSRLLPTGWYLRGLKVHPEFRRFGIAREITKQRLAWLAKRTCTVFVFLNDENKETVPMYQNFGFQEISRGWEFVDYEHKHAGQRGVLLELRNLGTEFSF